MSARADRVPIPGGDFIYHVRHRIMEGDCQYDHGPRIVRLQAFQMDRFPVTNQRFLEFLLETGYVPADPANFLRHWVDGTYRAGCGDHPVVWVSPIDARAYTVWSGGRLPTDIEWQYVAGGPERSPWPWGEVYRAGACHEKGDSTASVNAYPEGVSGFGCMDMCGNVWEWMDDTIDDGHHVFTLIRGGSHYKGEDRWHADGGPQRTDYHWKFQLLNEGMNRCATIGFRCVEEGQPHDPS